MTDIHPPLAPGEVHVWCAPLDLGSASAAALVECLSVDERARAERFRLEQDRRRYMAARGVLRQLLARYLGAAPEFLRLEYGARGKPELAPGWAGDMRFNVSHAGTFALYAFTLERRVGVDLERVREVPNAERVARRVFPPDELESWLALAAEDRLAGFFSRWTRLEALAKMHGGGVWWIAGEGQGDLPGDATLHELRVPEGYAGVVAVEGRVETLRQMWLGGEA